MGAKQSAEMTAAIALVDAGTPIREAARKSGVWWTSLHAALKRRPAKPTVEGELSPADLARIRRDIEASKAK